MWTFLHPFPTLLFYSLTSLTSTHMFVSNDCQITAMHSSRWCSRVRTRWAFLSVYVDIQLRHICQRFIYDQISWCGVEMVHCCCCWLWTGSQSSLHVPRLFAHVHLNSCSLYLWLPSRRCRYPHDDAFDLSAVLDIAFVCSALPFLQTIFFEHAIIYRLK